MRIESVGVSLSSQPLSPIEPGRQGAPAVPLAPAGEARPAYIVEISEAGRQALAKAVGGT